jgi:DNA-binding transcriptional ArsR family regulator
MHSRNLKQELFAALSHPLRRQILALQLRSGEPLSPSQMAETLEAPLGNVAYHVRKLESLGAIRLSGTKQARGAVEHFYVLADEVGEMPWSRQTLEEMVVPEPLPALKLELDRERFEADGPGVLDEVELKVIAMHFGFGNSEKVSFRAIGERLGLSESRVRTIERRGLRKLEQLRRDRGEDV